MLGYHVSVYRMILDQISELKCKLNKIAKTERLTKSEEKDICLIFLGSFSKIGIVSPTTISVMEEVEILFIAGYEKTG